MTVFIDFVLPFLAVLLAIVIVHELGHFLTAKALGVKVLEFGLGFPPRVISFPRRTTIYDLDSRVATFKSDETTYTVNLLPLGGFVRLVGEDTLDLRLRIKAASIEALDEAEEAIVQARLDLARNGSRAKITTLGLDLGAVSQDDVNRARRERAEILGIGVPLAPEAAAAVRSSRTKVTLAPVGHNPADAVRRFVDGFAAEVSRGLATKGALTRAVILGAGSFMNVMLPLAIFAAIFMFPQDTLEGRVRIQGVAPASPADLAGVLPGDIVQRVDGHAVANTADLAYRIRLKLGKPTTWDILREKRRLTGALGMGGDPGLGQPLPPAESTALTVRLVPRVRPPPGEGNAGILIATEGARIVKRSYPPWQAVPQAFVRMGETLILFRNEIISMFAGAQEAQVAGVVGIAQVTGEVARAGWMPVLELTALLSLNLAILNILPVPALDGGRLVFVALEWVRRGKRVSPERESLVHVVGFVVLISLMLVISYFDVLRIVRGESLLR